MKPQDRSHDDSKALQAQAEDRMLDTGLAELLGAEMVPDLATTILRRHERRQALKALPEPKRVASGQSLHFLGSMAAALLVSLTLLFLLRPQPELQAAELRIRILRGEITLFSRAGDSGSTRLEPGIHALLIRPGDRVSTDSLGSLVTFEDWGQIQLGPHSVLEFKTMETLTMNGKTIASSLVLGVITGTATWFGLSETSVNAAGSTIEVGSQEKEAALAANFEKRERKLLEENQRLNKKILELQNERIRMEVAKTEVDPATDEPVAMSLAKPVFSTQEYAEALEKVDWETMGTTMKDMLPLLSQLMEEWEETGSPSIELAGKIQALNGALLQQLPALKDGGIPGSGPNGIFTHPLVVSNQVNAFLKAAGIPLDERQIARLKALSKGYSTEDEVQRLSSAKDELKLAAVLAETDVKDRFYEDLRSVLSKEQIQKLYPEALKGLTSGDLFSTGLVWAQYAKRVNASGPAQFQERISGSISRNLRLEPSQQKKLDGIVSEWSREFPSSIWKNKAGFHESNQRFKIQDVRRNAKRQMAFMRRLVRDLDLTPKQRQRLLNSQAVFMPVSTK